VVTNIPNEKIDNWSTLSDLQGRILRVLPPPPVGTSLAGLPFVGDVIAKLGIDRTRATTAAVSRSLKRLEQAGFVASYQSELYNPGKALRFARIKSPTVDLQPR
jgi:hypothetical protein